MCLDDKIEELDAQIDHLSREEVTFRGSAGPRSCGYAQYTEAALFLLMKMRIDRYNELHEQMATLRAHKKDILAFQATDVLIDDVMSRPLRKQLKQILNGDT